MALEGLTIEQLNTLESNPGIVANPAEEESFNRTGRFPNSYQKRLINQPSEVGFTASELDALEVKRKEEPQLPGFLGTIERFGESVADFAGITKLSKGLAGIIGAPLATKVVNESTLEVNELVKQADLAADPVQRKALLLRAKSIADDTNRIVGDFQQEIPTQKEFAGAELKLGSFFVPGGALKNVLIGSSAFSVGAQLEEEDFSVARTVLDTGIGALTFGIFKGGSSLTNFLRKSKTATAFKNAAMAPDAAEAVDDLLRFKPHVFEEEINALFQEAARQSEVAKIPVARSIGQGLLQGFKEGIAGKFAGPLGLGGATFGYQLVVGDQSFEEALKDGLTVGIFSSLLGAGKESFRLRQEIATKAGQFTGRTKILEKAFENRDKMVKLIELLGSEAVEKLITRVMISKL